MSSTRRKTKDILATIPVELVDSLGREAQRSHRSRNAQLVAILDARYSSVTLATFQHEPTAQSAGQFAAETNPSL